MKTSDTLSQKIKSSDGDEPPDSSLKLCLKEAGKFHGSFLMGKSNYLRAEITTDIERCRSLWKEFSSEDNLFETWEFRYAFYKGYGFNPYFITLRYGTEGLALLPLWYDEDRKEYTWFGSDWQEEVNFFVKSPELIPLLLEAAPSPMFLNAISGERLGSAANRVNFEKDSPKYILKVDGFRGHEDFLMSLKKSRRHDLRKDRRRIETQNPEIIINNFFDIDSLIGLAKQRFRDKGQKASWEDSRSEATFREVIKLANRSYQVRMITVNIGGKAAGVDLNCLLNGTYYAVKCGYDVKKFPGIGNFINLVEIDDAVNLGMKKIDFLQNNYEWKERWFEQVPLFQYRKQ